MENNLDSTTTRDNASAKPTNNSGTARMSAETVRVIVQSTQKGDVLTDGGAALLATDAEYRLREIIQDAMKFMKHSKRRRLLPDDINAALRLRNVAQTYGFGRAAPDSAPLVQASNQPSPKRQKTDSLGWRAADGLDNVFFTADKPMSFKNILEKPLPPRPLDVTIAPHWLAVNGVQPAVPQNPPPVAESTEVKKEDVIANGTSTPTNGATVANGHGRDHVLSKELQLYFDTLTEELAGDDAKRIDALLDSVSQEPGLLQLLPYFVLHVTSTVRGAVDKAPKNGTNTTPPTDTLRNLLSSMRLVRAMHSNPNFRMESYLHKLFPVICTCVVGKRLYQKPRENHWALRDFSSRLLRDICDKYREKYNNLQTRLSKTFLSAFADPKKSLTTHYGAIVGLGTLGKYVVDATVMPLFGSYVTRLIKLLDDPKLKPGSVRRFELAKVFGAVMFALSVSKDDSVAKQALFSPEKHAKDAIKNAASLPASLAETVESMEKEFGKRMYPHQKSDSALRTTQ